MLINGTYNTDTVYTAVWDGFARVRLLKETDVGILVGRCKEDGELKNGQYDFTCVPGVDKIQEDENMLQFHKEDDDDNAPTKDELIASAEMIAEAKAFWKSVERFGKVRNRWTYQKVKEY